VPDAGGHGQQTLRNSGVHAVRSTPAVSFQVELSLEGLVDRFDPLADATEVAVAVGLVLAVRAQQPQSHHLGEFCEVLSGETLVGQQDLTPSRMRWWLRSSKAASTSRSPILGSARHHLMGIPSPVQTK
jgi:hypothetical protein